MLEAALRLKHCARNAEELAVQRDVCESERRDATLEIGDQWIGRRREERRDERCEEGGLYDSSELVFLVMYLSPTI